MSPPTRLFLALLFGVNATAGRAALAPGDRFPTLSARDLTGASLPATRDRVVLIDFWASWCAPCRESFPAYAKLQAEYAARGLLIVAISVDRDPAAFAAFRRRFQPPFVTVRDRARHLVSEVDVPAMPTCYLLDRRHRVRFVHRGFHGRETEHELRQEIDLLLAEPPPPS